MVETDGNVDQELDLMPEGGTAGQDTQY